MKKLLIIAAALPLIGAADGFSPVPYPDGWRNWRHVKSMVIRDGHPLYGAFGGIHHIYANDKAVEGYRTGRWPDGAVLVFDLHEASDADHAIVAGARKVLGVMHRDRKAYADTGGWGFEGFKGDSRTERAVGNQAASACFACHQSQAAPDYVFSTLKDD